MTVGGVSRRGFLKTASGTGLVLGAGTLLPSWLASAAAAATPVGPNEGVLVLITLDGGNDGLNTFVPISNGAYYDARRHLALRPDQTLSLTAERGAHPELSYLKAVWDQGRVAVVDGVGQPSADLSHFFSADRMMTAGANGMPGSTGWAGRILDGLNRQPLSGIAVGSRVPLLLEGHTTRGNAVPVGPSAIRAVNRNDWNAVHRLDALAAWAHTSTGLGSLADQAQAALGDSLGIATDLQPHLPEDSGETPLVGKLRLAANLINADVGVRVLSITHGDFDTHADQFVRQAALLRQLDDGLRTFFTTLDPGFANQVLVLGTSEFGRRVRSNADGSDHGTANSLFAVGAQVRGGFYGEAPSLTSLDSWGNQRHTVDYRQVFATVATTWLGADGAEIFGANHADLGFLRPPGQGVSTGARFPGVPASRRDMQAEVARLYLAYFGRRPDDDGLDYWVRFREASRSLAQVSEEFAASEEFRLRYGALSNRGFVEQAYQNVLGRNGDPGGVGYWTSLLDGGRRRGEVMIGFSESAEFQGTSAAAITHIEQTGPIGRLYRAYFLRTPDRRGLGYWIDSGLDRAQVSQQFAASAEFQARYGNLNDSQFVATAYRNVLGREPDPAGLGHWVGLLRSGRSRGEVMLGFSDSPEFVERVSR